MKKLLKHKWKRLFSKENPLNDKQCQICGTTCYWDFGYDHVMYQWGTNLTYKAPKCILSTDKPYNAIINSNQSYKR